MSNGKDNIYWEGFYRFVSGAVYSGQDVLGGELVLPSGLSLPIGQMIAKMRRSVVMKEMFKGGLAREDGINRATRFIDSMKSMGLRANAPMARTEEGLERDLVRTHSTASMVQMRRPRSAQRARISQNGKSSASQLPSIGHESEESPFQAEGHKSFSHATSEAGTSTSMRGSLFRLASQMPATSPPSPFPSISARGSVVLNRLSSKTPERERDPISPHLTTRSSSNPQLHFEPASSGKQGWAKKLGLHLDALQLSERSKGQAISPNSIKSTSPAASTSGATNPHSLPTVKTGAETASDPNSPGPSPLKKPSNPYHDLMDPNYVRALFSTPVAHAVAPSPPPSAAAPSSRFISKDNEAPSPRSALKKS